MGVTTPSVVPMRSSRHERGFTLLVIEKVQEGEDLGSFFFLLFFLLFPCSRNACAFATNFAFAFSFSCRFFFTSFSQCGGAPPNRWVGGRVEWRRWERGEEGSGVGSGADVSARSAGSTCCQPSPHQVRGMQLECVGLLPRFVAGSVQRGQTQPFRSDHLSRGRNATCRCPGIGRSGRVVFEAFCACIFITYLHSSARHTSFFASDFVFTPTPQQAPFC